MGRLEFLSGYSIGHIMKKLITTGKYENRIIHSYYRLWTLFYLHQEFIQGLRFGLDMRSVPTPIYNMFEWFNSLKLINEIIQ